jgi:GrpB-like predicted nucleotidyltransferase (UPF0157 family)
VQSHPPHADGPAGRTAGELVDAAFAEWLGRRAADPSISYLVLYDIAGDMVGQGPLDLDPDLRRALALRAIPVIYPGTELVSGTASGGHPVVVVDYDPSWSVKYETWRQRIVEVLPSYARVEHVGSTSVPGLAAKPIIDIQVSVADIDDEASYVPALESVGIVLRARDDVRRYLRREEDGERVIHLHVCELGSEWERDHLDFRDHLRSSERARQRYSDLKRQLADVWRFDRMAYTEAKGDLIRELLADARRGPGSAGDASGPTTGEPTSTQV